MIFIQVVNGARNGFRDEGLGGDGTMKPKGMYVEGCKENGPFRTSGPSLYTTFED